jgi:hypothetical protein
MEMLDKRLNDKGKNWRHVFKVGRVPCRPLTTGINAPRLLPPCRLGERGHLLQG